ncbi:UNVERIFIED_CONTAM: hypothetical protein Sradi_0879600 [Sesamum radiatum]|uniref:Uncharacterized protein n=1 Tax=Sesamum radiatum TaxID=300843 RepID=A0AAW2V328_SESRA
MSNVFLAKLATITADCLHPSGDGSRAVWVLWTVHSLTLGYLNKEKVGIGHEKDKLQSMSSECAIPTCSS